MCCRIPVILYCGFKLFFEHQFMKTSYSLSTVEECAVVVIPVDSLAIADAKSDILNNIHL